MILYRDEEYPDIDLESPITSITLADAYADIERFDHRPLRMYLNPHEYEDMLEKGTSGSLGEHQTSNLDIDVLGFYWGVDFIKSKKIPRGFIYVDAKEFSTGSVKVFRFVVKS